MESLLYEQHFFAINVDDQPVIHPDVKRQPDEVIQIRCNVQIIDKVTIS